MTFGLTTVGVAVGRDPWWVQALIGLGGALLGGGVSIWATRRVIAEERLETIAERQHGERERMHFSSQQLRLAAQMLDNPQVQDAWQIPDVGSVNFVAHLIERYAGGEALATVRRALTETSRYIALANRSMEGRHDQDLRGLAGPLPALLVQAADVVLEAVRVAEEQSRGSGSRQRKGPWRRRAPA